MVEKFADYIGQILVGVFIALALQSAVGLFSAVGTVSGQELLQFAEWSVANLCSERDQQNKLCQSKLDVDGAIGAVNRTQDFVDKSFPSIEAALDALGPIGWVDRTYTHEPTPCNPDPKVDLECKKMAKEEERHAIPDYQYRNQVQAKLESYQETKFWECLILIGFLLFQPWHLYVSIEALRRHPFVTPNLSPLYAKGSPKNLVQLCYFLPRVSLIAIVSILYGLMAGTKSWTAGAYSFSIFFYISLLLIAWFVHDAIIAREHFQQSSHTARTLRPRANAEWADESSPISIAWLFLDFMMIVLFVYFVWNDGGQITSLIRPFGSSFITPHGDPTLLIERNLEQKMLLGLLILSLSVFVYQARKWIKAKNYPTIATTRREP